MESKLKFSKPVIYDLDDVCMGKGDFYTFQVKDRSKLKQMMPCRTFSFSHSFIRSFENLENVYKNIHM